MSRHRADRGQKAALCDRAARSLYARRDARPFVKRLKRVQDELGHANDVRVAYGSSSSSAARRRNAEPLADAGAQLLEQHERALAKDEDKLRRTCGS